MIWLKVLLNDYFGSSTYVSYWAKSVQYLKWFLTVLWMNLKDILFIKWHINGTLLSEHAIYVPYTCCLTISSIIFNIKILLVSIFV